SSSILSLIAFKLFKWTENENIIPGKHTVSPFKKTLSGDGVLASLNFIGLLLGKGSPAFLGMPSLISLMIWIALGVVFYLAKRTAFNRIPQKELNYLILGEEGEKGQGARVPCPHLQ